MNETPDHWDDVILFMREKEDVCYYMSPAIYIGQDPGEDLVCEYEGPGFYDGAYDEGKWYRKPLEEEKNTYEALAWAALPWDFIDDDEDFWRTVI